MNRSPSESQSTLSTPTLDDLPSPPEDKTGWPWTEQTEPLPETQPDGAPWPKISVVTPSYNQGPFIEETIRSILLQGYPNLEYIVIDGGSTDESVEIIKKYDPWIDYWVSEEDNGQTHAINKGLNLCSGSIFNWINSDDFLSAGALKTIGGSMADVDMLAGCAWCFGEGKKWARETKNMDFKNMLKGFFGEGTYTQQGVWMKTQKVKECGGLDESFEYTMDQDLYYRYLRKYKRVMYINDRIAYFRHHENAKTAKNVNGFLRDHIGLAKKAKKIYSEDEKTVEYVINESRHLIKINKIKNNSNESNLKRAIKIIPYLFSSKREMVSRYALGAAKKILTSKND
jgi:glycosyltransferase involved in cell wall biosynthesis